MATSRVVVSFRPHWVDGWWLRLFTLPFADVDGHEVSCSWGQETSVGADPGMVGTDGAPVRRARQPHVVLRYLTFGLRAFAEPTTST